MASVKFEKWQGYGGVEGIVSNRKCVVRIPRVPVSLLSQQGCVGFTELWFSIQIT